jgi:hypothetical protein
LSAWKVFVRYDLMTVEQKGKEQETLPIIMPEMSKTGYFKTANFKTIVLTITEINIAFHHNA